MFKNRNKILGIILSASCLVSASAFASDKHTYEVTITNLTRGQTFTPILLATHQPGVSIFKLGDPASTELATIAESGNPGPLTDKLVATGRTSEVKNSGALLAPGKTVTMTISAGKHTRYISMASMLIPTNDAFVAVNGLHLPRGKDTTSRLALAYDAGSEPNDELCINIPGPVCGGAGASPGASGEGFVHVHAGIHSTGDDVSVLNAAERDWRNPVALIKIRRVNK